MSRLAPFSLRLTPEERSQLESQTGTMPLSSYIKSVVFAAEAPKYRKRRKPPVAEQQLLSEVLARLGQGRECQIATFAKSRKRPLADLGEKQFE